MKIKRLPNTDEILNALKANDFYCPCKTINNADTKCICKEFLEKDFVGECSCGLYMKEEV
jgi:hypothetical protein